jgi:hypothetical protein
MICQLWGVVISSISCLLSVTVSEKCVRHGGYTLEQHAFLYDTYVKCGSVGENFDINFVMKEFPRDKQFIIW